MPPEKCIKLKLRLKWEEMVKNMSNVSRIDMREMMEGDSAIRSDQTSPQNELETSCDWCSLQNPSLQRCYLTSLRCDRVSITFCHFIFVSPCQHQSQEVSTASVFSHSGGSTSRRSVGRGNQFHPPLEEQDSDWGGGGNIVEESWMSVACAGSRRMFEPKAQELLKLLILFLFETWEESASCDQSWEYRSRSLMGQIRVKSQVSFIRFSSEDVCVCNGSVLWAGDVFSSLLSTLMLLLSCFLERSEVTDLWPWRWIVELAVKVPGEPLLQL